MPLPSSAPSPADDPDATQRAPRPGDFDPDATVRTPRPREVVPGPATASRSLEAGQKVFGRFTLQRVLGRGGMGVVWLARDVDLETDVALKFLPEVVVLDEGALRDLKREALRSRELTHANIVRIHDFVQGDGCAAIVMEYIDGTTLSKRRLDESAEVFAPEALLPWVEQLTEALDYAHTRARVVHRDLKPANLMINSRGELKVADFGISATLTDTATRLSRTTVGSSGSPPYMSPQQMLGRKAAVTDDVYALGATLYELLTGKPPFYTGNILLQVQSELPPPMVERRAEVLGDTASAQLPPISSGWEETIAACLAKDADDRPQSMGEVYRRLSGAAVPVAPAVASSLKTATATVATKQVVAPAGEPTVAPTAERRSGAGRWLAIVVGVAAVAFAAWQTLRSPTQAPTVPAAPAVDLDRYLIKTTPPQAPAVVEQPVAESPAGEPASASEAVKANARLGSRSILEGLKIPILTATAHLRVSPSEVMDGVTCTLDGDAVTIENDEVKGLKAGKRVLAVSHPDYEPWSGEVELLGGKTVDVVIELTPKPGTLSFVTTPKRASIRITGGTFKDAAFTIGGLEILTPYRKELPPGDYLVRYALEGYVPVERLVTVKANQPVEFAVTLEKLQIPVAGQVWTIPGLDLTLMPIAAGSFRMGSENGDADEKPLTTVRLSRPYWLGRYEVTQAEWLALMGNNPSHFKGDSLPVEQVSWDEVMVFCQKLTEREQAAGRLPAGFVYTLPTEAQWEYACRAGTTTDFAGMVVNMAWYDVNSGKTTHPVGQKQANAWGLFDMHGNVWEWCRDPHGPYAGGSVTDPSGRTSGADRISRGGGWLHDANACRSAQRDGHARTLRGYVLGFRVALSASEGN